MRSTFTIAPVISKIYSRLFGHADLDKFAIDSVQINPAERYIYQWPTFCLSGQYEKIKSAFEFSPSLEYEINLAKATEITHIETTAYLLEGMTLIDGVFCNRKSTQYMSFQKPPLKMGYITQYDETAAMCTTPIGNEYFAHFIFDNIPTAMMAAEYGLPVFASIGKRRTEQMTTHLELVCKQYQDIQAAFFEKIWIFNDVGINRYKAQRIQEIRQSLTRFSDQDAAKKCYITRGDTGSLRSLENEAELLDQLSSEGFTIINPEEMSTAEIHREISGCSLAVGVEGSHLIHGILGLAKGGALLCIQPPFRFNTVYRSLADSLGLKWGFVVGEPLGNTQHQNFRLDVRDLLNSIDMFPL